MPGEGAPEGTRSNPEGEPQGSPDPVQDEVTLVIIKPDAAEEAHDIINVYKRDGFVVKRHKWIGRPNRRALEIHYAEHFGMPYYDGLIEAMTGKIVVLELAGGNAIQRVRDLNGPTDPTKATPEQANTIRVTKGGKRMPYNAVHAADSKASSRRERWLWFESGIVVDENPEAWRN